MVEWGELDVWSRRRWSCEGIGWSRCGFERDALGLHERKQDHSKSVHVQVLKRRNSLGTFKGKDESEPERHCTSVLLPVQSLYMYIVISPP